VKEGRTNAALSVLRAVFTRDRAVPPFPIVSGVAALLLAADRGAEGVALLDEAATLIKNETARRAFTLATSDLRRACGAGAPPSG
jgi:hypothetical protein